MQARAHFSLKFFVYLLSVGSDIKADAHLAPRLALPPYYPPLRHSFAPRVRSFVY